MLDPVVILFGGTSNERRVSVATAQSVAESLLHDELWFMERSGAVFEVATDELLRHAAPFGADFRPKTKRMLGANLEEAVCSAAGSRAVFFLALHGGEGENGVVQSILEGHRVPYTGSNARASAIAFNKLQAKDVVRRKGLSTAPSAVLPQNDFEEASAKVGDFLRRHGRIIVKPVADGSSVNVFKIGLDDDIRAVAEHVAAAHERYFAEVFVKGREITVGVIDDGTRVRALPPSEVRMEGDRLFDFAGKYLGNGAVEITPADLSAELLREVQQVAVHAHTAIGCDGYSRTDIILSDEDSRPVYLETNTLPGLTRASFVPQQLKADNTPFRDFLRAQVELARNRSSYDAVDLSRRRPVGQQARHHQ